MTSTQDHQQPQTQPSGDIALLRLMATIMRPHWRPLVVALLLLVVTAGLSVIPPYLVGRAIDGPILERDIAGLWLSAALYAGVAVVLFGLQFAQSVALQDAGQRGLSDLRGRLFSHMLNQGHADWNRTPVGDRVTRLTNDIDALNALLSTSIVTILTESATLVAVVIVMFSVNWRLALLALAVLPVLTFVTYFFRQRIRNSSTGERSALARTSSFLNEHLHGMTLIQLFGHQKQSMHEFDGLNLGYRRALLSLRQRSAAFLAVQEVLAAVGIAMLLYGGGQGVLAGWTSLGMLVAFVQYTERAFQPILRLFEEFNTIQVAFGAAERVHRTLHTAPSIAAPTDPVTLPQVQGAIELRHVSFAYTQNDPVLRDLSLQIPAGQTVAIVGATGAGKSSLVGLLARFYDPQQGQVLLDGIDIRQLRLPDLRRAVTVVPQDPVCFAGSIAFNIGLYRDDLTAADIERAAKWTNADQFIEHLPGGYDYQVLAGGSNLSVGQRQLLALARALALSPHGVLVLDEATSSIDTATEALIQDALARVLRSRTSVVIAHRLSTIQRADRILVMQRGVIVEDGPHNHLLALGGHYARLHHYQHTTQPELG